MRSRVESLFGDLHAFIKTYGLSSRVPYEHVIVFDEAQRAGIAAIWLTSTGLIAASPIC